MADQPPLRRRPLPALRQRRPVHDPRRAEDLHLPPLSASSLKQLFVAAGLTGLLLAPAPAPLSALQHTPSPDRCAARADTLATAFPFAPPVASALEPSTRLAPVRIERGARRRWVGLVELGDRFPFWLVRPPDRRPDALRLAAAVAGGAFTRFDLEENGNEFIEAHFRVGLRLRAARGPLEARAEFYHVSSHLGDEYLVRTGREPISTSREGLELLLGAHPVDEVRVYGGAGLLVRSTEDLDPGSFRGGIEWRSDHIRWGPLRPYAGGELFWWEEVGWRPMASAEAGVSLDGGRYRLALVGGTGPSRAEQFFREDETLYGFTFAATF